MPLDRNWIDHLFSKLTVRYGIAFMAQYRDLNADDVKADWAVVLAGCDGAMLTYGLRYLPNDRPPTSAQFREICRRCPPPAPQKALPYEPKADPAKVARILAKALQPPEDGLTHAERVVARLEARQAAGQRLNGPQLAMLLSCRTAGDVSTQADAAMFTPIPRHLWPESMRDDPRVRGGLS